MLDGVKCVPHPTPLPTGERDSGNIHRRRLFTYSTLLWFLPLAGLVVLIHLINMFRHRRVEWAAFEFLLAGYRKSRTRILLQQLLLLLLRTSTVVAIILMFAQPRLEGPLAELLGGRPTHHVVLLDDSYSMNDRNAAEGGTPLFDDVKEIVRQIAENGASRRTNDRISLIRFSKAGAILNGEEPDIAEQVLNADGLNLVRNTIAALESSESGAGPEEPLRAAIHLLRQSMVRLKPVVYFLSDFRQRDWENPASILKALDEVKELGGMIRMVRALDEERPNLTLASLELVAGIHAADVDLLLDATVINNGPHDVDNVQISLYVDGVARPGQTIPGIKARDKTTPPIRFPVRLDGVKPHRIEVRLPPDAVPNDNRRFLALTVPASLEVLLIAPQQSAPSAQYVRVALAPGGAKSGLHVRIEPPMFLMSTSLDRFDAIFLLDVPKLDASAIRNLEEYVESGGGLAFFTGPETDPNFVRNELFKDGKGLFPFAPLAVGTLAPDFLSQTPDVIVRPHPIFRLFGEGESPLLRNVKIDQYVVAEKQVGESELTKTLATLRDGSPLVVEKSFGKGRTVTFLTTAAPIWNNWGRGSPSFVVVMLELAAWLAQRNRDETSLIVDAPLLLQVNPAEYKPNINITTPGNDDTDGGQVRVSADAAGQASFPATYRAGFYEAVLRTHSDRETSKLFAVNVDPSEGDTRLVEAGTLSDWLHPLDLSLESAAGFSAPTEFTGAGSLSDALLLIVVLLLLAETFLAGRLLPPTTNR